MREMTRDELVWLIRKQAVACGTLRALCARQGVHISTVSNMIHGRSRFTPRVLRLLGLEHVRIVDKSPAVPVAAARTVRRYRPMWQLGDWPSRYSVAAE